MGYTKSDEAMREEYGEEIRLLKKRVFTTKYLKTDRNKYQYLAEISQINIIYTSKVVIVSIGRIFAMLVHQFT